MIPLSKIDSVIAFFGLLLFVGALEATLTSFDPTVGGATSDGNIRLQATSGIIYLATCFLILARIERFLYFAQKNLFILLLLLVPIFSIFWSIAPEVTARRGIALFGTSLFGMYLAFALSAERVIRILAVVYGATAVASLIVIVLLPTYGTHQAGEYVGLWRGLYAQKNEFGATMAMATIVIYLCPKKTLGERILGRAAIVLCFFLMLMSQSRAAWISFACVCVAGFALRRMGGKGGKTGIKAVSLLLVSIVVGGVVVQNAVPLLELIGKDPTLSGRTGVWSFALERAAEHPILGYGYRAYWIEGNKARLQPTESWADYINHGHNTYLDLYVELGYLGLAAFLVTFWSLLRHMLRRIKAMNDYINIWGSATILFIAIRGTAESTIFQHADINWVMFVYFYAVFQAYRRSTKRQSESSLFSMTRAIWPRVQKPFASRL